MAHSSIKDEIVEQLDRLSPENQRRVLDFIQALVLSVPEGVPGKQLLRFSGILSSADAQAMTQAIEEGCERATASQLAHSELVGLWKDRDDIADSADYARQLREQAQKRREKL